MSDTFDLLAALYARQRRTLILALSMQILVLVGHIAAAIFWLTRACP